MTRNPEYNELLLRWRAEGSEAHPECEECGRDLTDQDVHDTGTGWLCTACRNADNSELFFSDEELRLHERRQMGIA